MAFCLILPLSNKIGYALSSETYKNLDWRQTVAVKFRGAKVSKLSNLGSLKIKMRKLALNLAGNSLK